MHKPNISQPQDLRGSIGRGDIHYQVENASFKNEDNGSDVVRYQVNWGETLF